MQSKDGVITSFSTVILLHDSITNKVAYLQ